MQRRGGSGKPVKGQRHNAIRRKARKALTPPTSIAELREQLDRRTRERDEALEQQAATVEVLKVISSSSFDLPKVLNSLVEAAARLCEADTAQILRPTGKDGSYYTAASYRLTPDFKEHAQTRTLTPGRGTLVGRVLLERKSLQISDVFADPEYTSGEAARLGGWRTILGVPLLREGILIGLLILHRAAVRPFTDKQTELIEAFAAQAVIAIENTRLLNELRESFQQQTATADVLRVISSSPGELQPVFETIASRSVALCGATYGVVFRFDGELISVVAAHNLDQAAMDTLNRQFPMRPDRERSLLGQVTMERSILHIRDVAAEHRYTFAKALGIRSFLGVPMLRDGNLIGGIALYRRKVELFSDRQIELVKAFAAQSLIAIDSARLLNDLNKLNQQLEQRVTDQVSEIERMGRLRRFLPPQVADLIVASGAEKQLESHRREITALFCDLRGFTGFSESSDPEDVIALLREYHAAIGEIINTYGGTLERYAGDGVMVVFNDPIPVDNPALQAVQMALEMRTAIGALTEKWRRLGHEIGFGIGVAHGFATLGTIGFEGRFDYAAIGTVSNVASRLCDEAKPGQILISPRVLMAVEKDVTVELVGDFALKGIRRPLTAYNVLHTKAAD